jgi:hypothetical protein
MGQISEIGSPALLSTSDNFLRPETLREANDVVSNAISRLSIFHLYDIGGFLHSSSDGPEIRDWCEQLQRSQFPQIFRAEERHRVLHAGRQQRPGKRSQYHR